jgi:hypothetical protein
MTEERQKAIWAIYGKKLQKIKIETMLQAKRYGDLKQVLQAKIYLIH